MNLVRAVPNWRRAAKSSRRCRGAATPPKHKSGTRNFTPALHLGAGKPSPGALTASEASGTGADEVKREWRSSSDELADRSACVRTSAIDAVDVGTADSGSHPVRVERG